MGKGGGGVRRTLCVRERDGKGTGGGGRGGGVQCKCLYCSVCHYMYACVGWWGMDGRSARSTYWKQRTQSVRKTHRKQRTQTLPTKIKLARI